MDSEFKTAIDSECKTVVDSECEIAIDTEFKTADDIFQCTMCGECCTGFGGTYVSEQDIIKISAFIHCDSAKFTEKFCAVSGSKYVLTLSENGKCVFFDTEKQCTIHPVKPDMCKAWPFIRTVANHPENWNAMAGSCPGMKKNVPYDTLKTIVSSLMSVHGTT